MKPVKKAAQSIDPSETYRAQVMKKEKALDQHLKKMDNTDINTGVTSFELAGL